MSRIQLSSPREQPGWKQGRQSSPFIDDVVTFAPRSPFGGAGWPEEADHRHTQRRSHVHGTIVIADKQSAPPENSGKTDCQINSSVHRLPPLNRNQRIKPLDPLEGKNMEYLAHTTARRDKPLS